MVGSGQLGQERAAQKHEEEISGQKTRRGRSVPMPVPVRSRCLALVGATPGTNRRLPACPCRGHLLTGAENFQGARATTSGARPSSGSWEDRAGSGTGESKIEYVESKSDIIVLIKKSRRQLIFGAW